MGALALPSVVVMVASRPPSLPPSPLPLALPPTLAMLRPASPSNPQTGFCSFTQCGCGFEAAGCASRPLHP
eukprot:2686721-Alexandrium_andersonii.AAC.1